MRELHLFAGIGGGILAGALLGHRCVAAVEIDSHCRQVLAARQADGCLDSFPIHDDIRTFNGSAWRGRVDIVCGGFPCQPWSSAGKRQGIDDPRHLWPEMARVVEECRPAFVFAENVSLAAFEEPWRDLRGLGYRVPPALCLAAADVGAPHLRKRWWMLAADPDSDGLREQPVSECRGGGEAVAQQHGIERDVADSTGVGRREGRGEVRPRKSDAAWNGDGQASDACRAGLPNSRQGGFAPRPPSGGGKGTQCKPQRRGESWWAVEPPLGRVAHGVPARVGQLRALGNAQVPQVAAQAFRLLMEQLVGGAA